MKTQRIRASQKKMLERFREAGFGFQPGPIPGILAWLPIGTVTRDVWISGLFGFSVNFEIRMAGIYEWDEAQASGDEEAIRAASRWEVHAETVEEAHTNDILTRREARRKARARLD